MNEKCDLTKGSTVARENFYTTLPLLEKLTYIGRHTVGAIRKKRLQGAPLKKKAEIQKETRGKFDYTSDGNNLIFAWRDNKAVIVGHQLFVVKSSFANKALVESWEKTCRRTKDKSF